MLIAAVVVSYSALVLGQKDCRQMGNLKFFCARGCSYLCNSPTPYFSLSEFT